MSHRINLIVREGLTGTEAHAFYKAALAMVKGCAMTKPHKNQFFSNEDDLMLEYEDEDGELFDDAEQLTPLVRDGVIPIEKVGATCALGACAVGGGDGDHLFTYFQKAVGASVPNVNDHSSRGRVLTLAREALKEYGYHLPTVAEYRESQKEKAL